MRMLCGNHSETLPIRNENGNTTKNTCNQFDACFVVKHVVPADWLGKGRDRTDAGGYKWSPPFTMSRTLASRSYRISVVPRLGRLHVIRLPDKNKDVTKLMLHHLIVACTVPTCHGSCSCIAVAVIAWHFLIIVACQY